MTQRLRISFLAQARFDNLIRGAAKITKEVMKSHGCAFQFCLSYGSFQCPCLQFFHMELSRRKVPVYVSMLISSHFRFRTGIKWMSKPNSQWKVFTDRVNLGTSISTLNHMNIAGCSHWIICTINHGFLRRKYSCPSMQWLQRQPVISVYNSQISNSVTQSFLCLHFRSFLSVHLICDLVFVLCFVKLQSNRAPWLMIIMIVWLKVGNIYNALLLWFLCIFKA